MIEFVSEENLKLSKFLEGKGFGYYLFKKLIRKKDIKVNGKRVGEDIEIFPNDKITVYAEIPQKKLYDIIYEDDNIIAVYKYPFFTSEEVFAAVSSYFPVYFIHRLDRNTDGILLFAKNKEAEKELLLGFKERTFKKFYIAKVYGTFSKKEGVLSDYLLKNEETATVKIYKERVKNSVKIITKYKVLDEDSETSTLEVELITGKTHQIRAHLAFYGHFIIGDGKYGIDSINRKFKAKRQLLTAKKIILSFDGGVLGYLDKKVLEIDNAF